MSEVKMTVEGIEELQAANRRMIEALEPSNDLGRAIRFAALEAQEYLISITHVVSGAYRASHRIGIEQGGARASLYIDSNARNPHGQRPAIYGPIEEARGGSHAAYERTVRERGPQIAARALTYINVSLAK